LTLDAYTTEQEQIDKIKKWWDENGKAVVLGLAIGIGGLFGYRYWESARVAEGQNASINYEHLLGVAPSGTSDEATATGDAIIAGYPKSTYARLSALVLAKLAVDSGDLTHAKERLQWVIDNSGDGKTKPIALARMAQILLAEGNVEEADTLIGQIDPIHAEQFAELRGDILAAQGEPEKAREMYNKTLDLAQQRGITGAVVQLKIDNINLATRR
jgi:predicted negative regulator of RcsB-dependent stress response